MDRAEQNAPLARFGWANGLQRWFKVRPTAARAPQREHPHTQPWSAQLNQLSLEIAGCEQLSQQIPPLLRPLEHALRLEPGLAATHSDSSRLVLALALNGQPGTVLLHTPEAELPPGVGAFLRYQLDGPLRALQDTPPQRASAPLRLPLPGSPLQLHLQALECSPLKAWLLLLTPGSIDTACADRLGHIAHAMADGLNIWSRHQQRLEQAIGNERRAHAAELHDSLAQILGYLRLGTSRLDARCGQCDQPELQAIAADLSQQTRHAYRLMRELISRARLTLEGGSLHSALSSAVSEFEQRSGLVFELDDRCPALEPDEISAIQLVMIVREALCNAVRHAHASHLRVQLLPDPPTGLLLRIEDNGQGIDPARKRPDSFGLGIMQERAARIGAQLSISGRPGGGTRVELQWSGSNHD